MTQTIAVIHVSPSWSCTTYTDENSGSRTEYSNSTCDEQLGNLSRLYPILVADGAKSDGLYGYPNDWLTIAGDLFSIFYPSQTRH